MTEYKKLLALQVDLADVTTLLTVDDPQIMVAEQEPLWMKLLGGVSLAENKHRVDKLRSCVPEVRYRLLLKGQDLVENMNPRMEKMLARAKETDPDKQLYNESMCQKIEAMCQQFFEEASPNFDILVNTVETEYFEFVEAEARVQAFQDRVATELSDVTSSEEKGRIVVKAEEKRAAACIAEAMRSSLHDILEAERLREEAKWVAEINRRKDELRQLEQTVSPWKEDCWKHVHSLLEGWAPVPLEAATTSRKETSAPPIAPEVSPEWEVQFRLLKGLHRLVDEVLKHPESDQIRTLRNSNDRFVQDFGHPCFTPNPEVEQRVMAQAQLCQPRDGRRPDEEVSTVLLCHYHRTVEVIMAAIGYRVKYSSTPGPTPKRSDVAMAAVSYCPLGFERYGERVLELCEPDAMEDSASWIQWFDSNEAVRHGLEEMVLQRLRWVQPDRPFL